MANDPLFIVAAIAALGVLAILLIGIGGFAKGVISTRNTPTA